MPRRGENIRKRKDGRWEGRYIAGRTPDGKAIYKSVYGYSYAEVKEKLKNIDQQPPKIDVVFSLQGMPVEMICKEWLEDIRVKVKASTRGNYIGHVDTHIIPYFDDMGGNQLTNETANAFIRAKIDSGLSKKTVCDIALILLQIIEFAERKKYIANFDYNDIFIPKASKIQVPVLSVADDNKLVSYCFSHIDHSTAGVLLARYTGIRLGELCALTWRDIDFEAGLLHIRKTLQRIKNTDPNAKSKTKIIIDTPKSACSIRSIPIPDFFLSELKKLKGNQDLDCYILSGTRKYVEPRLFQKRFTKILVLACVMHINIHVLRHTFSTRAIALGFDIKALSEILGHASVKFTLECYVHSSDELKKMYMERQAICS
ncbi:MAG: site-specific integrase [Oscillospiraceae bacterium]|nr:site-specific integrase [Oscillospiraceae bacterium]